jgi:hypothetical protein
MLSALALTALVLVLGGCSSGRTYWSNNSTYWSRPDAKLEDVARESGACYKAAVEAVEGEFLGSGRHGLVRPAPAAAHQPPPSYNCGPMSAAVASRRRRSLSRSSAKGWRPSVRPSVR